MVLNDIKQLAELPGAVLARLGTKALIKSIQWAEGNLACYATNYDDSGDRIDYCFPGLVQIACARPGKQRLKSEQSE